MRYRYGLLTGFVLIAGTLSIILSRHAPDPVSITFLRYEKTGDNWRAVMELCNSTFQPISYNGSSRDSTTTQYIWDSPQIDYTRRAGARPTTLRPKQKVVFEVLVLTTKDDWRVGLDYQFIVPKWAQRFPPWLRRTTDRCRIIRSGEGRAWSPMVTRPSVESAR